MTKMSGDLGAAGLAVLLAGGSWGGVSFASSHGQSMPGMNHGQMMQGAEQPGMAGMDHDATDQGTAAGETEAVTEAPWTQAYRAANQAMHSAMDLEFSEDADIDFARGMIAHHQGAIDMSRVVLKHGKDPELRELAEKVIAAQEGEIEFLRNWLSMRSQ